MDEIRTYGRAYASDLYSRMIYECTVRHTLYDKRVVETHTQIMHRKVFLCDSYVL